MAHFLFWNLQRKPLFRQLASIVRHRAIDVLVLAEAEGVSGALVDWLRGECGVEFEPHNVPMTKVEIFLRRGLASVSPLLDAPRWTIKRVEPVRSRAFLIVGVHMPSQLHWEREDITLELTELGQDIRRSEGNDLQPRTLLVGDFNLNPFDTGLVAVHGIQGVMTKAVARAEERIVQGRSYSFFYNPMWGLFGDRTHGPPGSYFYNAPKPINYFWNLFDQVMVRPSLVECLTSVEILDHDGDESLLNSSGRPDANRASDHLPLFFRLNLED